MLKIKIPKANWFKELLPVSKLDNIEKKKKENIEKEEKRKKRNKK